MTAEAIPTAPPAGTKVLRIGAVASRTGKGKSTIWAEVKRGDFPKPIRIGRHAVGWLEHVIDQHNLSRPAA
jgi:prophage regulatory protein